MTAHQIKHIIVGMITDNNKKIKTALSAESYGLAAHYDSKNVALIDLLEVICECPASKGSVKKRLEKLKLKA